MEFVVGILLLLTFFGLAYYCIKGHNLMIGFLIITILWTALSFLGAAFASPEFLSTTAFYSNGEPVKAIAILNKIYQSAPEGWGHHAGQRLLGRLVRPRPDGDRHCFHP